MKTLDSKDKISDYTHVNLARRAREKLLNNPSYQRPKTAWLTKVYYIRVEANAGPLWKIGITCSNFHTRYCKADRKIIWEIATWQYWTREEAEAHEKEVMEEFANDLYTGDPVLRSGGDGELFTRDVLGLDSQNDIHALVRRERLAEAALISKTSKGLNHCARALRSRKSEGLSSVKYKPLILLGSDSPTNRQKISSD